MENNAIMQRVMMLSEMWTESLTKNPKVSVFAWVGASSVEFKTIKGFVMYQTSLEKTLQDTVLCLSQPFEPELQLYGDRITSDLQNYFREWNKDPSLTEVTGKIEWEAQSITEKGTEAKLFAENINMLAKALKVTGRPEKLVLALFPSALTDVKAFSNWIELLMNAGISDSVRIMLYESRDSMYFKSLSKKKEEEFKYLQPDLDIAGAMNQILEETKAKKGTEEEKDMVSFQQALIKMNEAIGYSDEEDVRYYGNVCLKLAEKYEWQPQIALVHFFEYTFYASVQKVKEAHQAIDKAIAITAKAAEKEKGQHDQTQYQYYIAKGNLYFMSKEFEQAAVVYRKSLELDRTGASPLMLAGIHQMLGNSLRKYATKTEARTCFNEGWQLLSSEGDEALKENTMAMFYAKDMLSVADQEMLNTYTPIMNQLWGNNWQNNLTDQYNQLNKTN